MLVPMSCNHYSECRRTILKTLNPGSLSTIWMTPNGLCQLYLQNCTTKFQDMGLYQLTMKSTFNEIQPCSYQWYIEKMLIIQFCITRYLMPASWDLGLGAQHRHDCWAFHIK